VTTGRPVNRLRVDLVAECIWRDGERFSVPPKAFRVLRCLMERSEQLVTKDELLDAVWPETYVIDKVLNIAVSELRQALGDDPKQPRFIATVHRRGFRWIGPAAASLASALEEDSGTFVGRAETLGELERCYTLTLAGQRQVVFVTGDAGIGKTTLIDRFLHGLTRDAATRVWIAHGQCVDRYGVGEMYRPLLDAAEALVRAGGETMRAIFRKHAPTWLLRMHDVLGADEITELQQSVSESSTERMQRELERALEAASAEQAVVLVLEDLHWSDIATVGLLGALAAGRGPARLLILGTYRVVDAIAQQHPIVPLKRDLLGRRQCIEVALDGLTSEAVGTFLDQRFGKHRLPASLAPRLQAQTSGNPLFLLNALAGLVQRGWLYDEDGLWQCGVDVDTLASAVPDGTRELIAMRLDVLPPATQELLEAASLVGVSFTTQVVAAALERSSSDVEAECRRLTHTLFLQQGDETQWPDGSRGRQQKFRHVLYRQVLEERVPPSRRQLLHRRIAERMESGHGNRAGEIAATLRFHYEQAGDVFRAVDCIELMVQQSFARRAMHEAMLLYDDAVVLLGRLPVSEPARRRLRQMKIGLGFLATTTVGSGDARSTHAVAELADLEGAPLASPDRLASLAMVATGHIAAGAYHCGREAADEILTAGGDGALEALLTGHSLAGIASFYLGDFVGALAHLEHTARIAPTVPPIRIGEGPLGSIYDTAVPALGVRAQTLTLSGRAEQGAAAIEAALARARTIDMPWYLGWALSGACSTGVLRRDPVEVRRRAQELERHCGDGQEHLKSVARFMSHWAAVMESGDPAVVVPLRQALDEVLSVTDPMVASRYLSMLAEAHLRVLQYDSALAALDRADAERGENRFYDAELRRQRAVLVLGRGRSGSRRSMAVKEAEAALEAAVDIAVEQGATLLGLRATVDLARLWRAAERRKDARRRLTQALAVFNEGFDDADLRQARELIGTL
jgi:DNA-binding winged helix-turn-helix (wHTH) protein/tetratricopeptide (TPR) repeat protein